MNQQKNLHIFFWSITGALIALVLVVQLKYSGYIDQLYETEEFSTLNQLAKVSTNQSLDYYIGRIDDEWVGPMSNVIFHGLLAGFCLLFLRQASSRIFFLSIFVFLIVTKFNVLFYPPYGDAIGGPFAEGWWLAQNNFNYPGLAEELPYQAGGPRVYFFSIYPTYLALLYKLISNIKTFLVINHMFVYAMAAGIIVCVRNLLKSQFSSAIAMLGSIIVLALPIFQSQTEAINMELPCLLFSVLAITYLVQRRIVLASLYAVISTLIKGHGLIPSATVIIMTLLLIIFNKNFRRWPVFLSLALVSAISLFKMGSKFFLKDQHVSAGMVKLFAGLPSLKIMTLPWIYGISLLIFISVLCIKEKSFKNITTALARKYYSVGVIFVCALFWYLMFLNFYAVSPRYKLALAPYLVMCLIFAVLMIRQVRSMATYLLFGTILVTSLGSYGLYHYRLPANYHVMSERSLQYRNNVKMDMKLAKLLEEEYSQYKVGAPFIMAQMLAMPELGYVSKPLDVMAYGMPVRYGNIKNFEGLKKSDIIGTIWVGVAANYIEKPNFTYPVHKSDKVIRKFELGENEAVIFRGGFAIEQRRQMMAMYQKRFK